MRRLKKKHKIIVLTVSGLILAAAVICALLYFGVIHINHPELFGLHTKGVDVSSYQGDIDWEILAGNEGYGDDVANTELQYKWDHWDCDTNYLAVWPDGVDIDKIKANQYCIYNEDWRLDDNNNKIYHALMTQTNWGGITYIKENEQFIHDFGDYFSDYVLDVEWKTWRECFLGQVPSDLQQKVSLSPAKNATNTS